MRLLFRLVSLLVFGAAFAAIVVDGTRSVAAGHVILMQFAAALDKLAPGELAKIQAAITAKAPAAWPPVATVLGLPTWVVLGVLAIILYLLTQPRSPTIGYTRR